MLFLDLTLSTPAENAALDEALLLRCEIDAGDEVLRLWESSNPCVVLGAASILAQDVDEAACLTDDVPIMRRASGGGTVLLGPGCLCYSIVTAIERAGELRHIGPSYKYILDCVCRALAVPNLCLAGTSDLALGSLKVSGNAQQRKRHYLLHHGTLLYAFDLSKVARYLRLPARQPHYRGQRPHEQFLTNLPLERKQIAAALRRAFNAEYNMDDWPVEKVRELVASKYALSEWTRRR